MCWKKHYSLISILVFCFQAFETDARKQWCMNIRYENPTEGCCGGVIYNRSRDQIDYECCNDNVYKRSEQTCCGRVLRNNTDIHQEDICCENQFHPKNKGVCCDNIFYRHGDKNHHSCCGKLLNDNNNKMCCNGKLHVGSKHPGKKCCGNETYNNSTHWCDKRNPDIILQHGQKTCNGEKYWTKTQICCYRERKITNKATVKDDSCCGTTPYNSKERTCTDNNQLLPEGNTPEPFWINMCGNKSIDETIQGCCNGTPFNLLNQICCGGTILHKSKKCCDGRVLDTAKYVCCNRETIEQQVKLPPNHNDCCLLKNGSLQTYNRKYYECTLTSGVIQNGSRCGPLLYNKSIDLCCQGILFRNGTLQKRKCCGVKSYDTECQECESDVIKDLTKCIIHVKLNETQLYCGRKEYNRDKDLCCHGELYFNGKNQNKGCCGVKSYLKKNKKCHNGEIRMRHVCLKYCQRSWIQNNHTSQTWNKNKTNMCNYKVYTISYLKGKTWKTNNRNNPQKVVFKKDCRCLFKGKKEAILLSKRITKAGKIRGQFYILQIPKKNKRFIKNLKKDIRRKNKSCKSKKKLRKKKTKRE